MPCRALVQQLQVDRTAFAQVIVVGQRLDRSHSTLSENVLELIEVERRRTRPRRIDRHDRPAHQICVSVLGQPTERCCSTTGTILSCRADDNQSICFVENSVHGRVHDSGATVGDDDVVVHLENSESIEVVLLVERLRSFRICLTRKDFESLSPCEV